MNEIAITRGEFKKFKEAYGQAKKERENSFTFSFNNQQELEFLVDYAKYLIEYVESIDDEDCPISIYA
jgi:hypothetical protein